MEVCATRESELKRVSVHSHNPYYIKHVYASEEIMEGG